MISFPFGEFLSLEVSAFAFCWLLYDSRILLNLADSFVVTDRWVSTFSLVFEFWNSFLSSLILAKSNSRPFILSFVVFSPKSGGLVPSIAGATNLGEFLPETIESLALILAILISIFSILLPSAPKVFCNYLEPCGFIVLLLIYSGAALSALFLSFSSLAASSFSLICCMISSFLPSSKRSSSSRLSSLKTMTAGLRP